MALMNPAMMSQSMDKLHGHHTRVGHRVGGEGGAKGMVTETNWGKAQAMTKKAASQERTHNPRSGCRGIWTKTILGGF